MTTFTVPQDCVANPCDLGESCSFHTHSTFCDRCASNEIGPDGVACTACPVGTEPTPLQTACVSCPPGTESKIGLCTTCPAGKVGAGGTCGSCPGANEEPMDGATRCQCQAGFYNSSYGMAVSAVTLASTPRHDRSAAQLSCRECPRGGVCPGGARHPSKKRFRVAGARPARSDARPGRTSLIPDPETFSTTIQPPYSSTKGRIM
jgi:hypothetical protein